MSQSLKIGLLGLGTVGQGVVEVLDRHAGAIAGRAGGPIEIKRIKVRELAKPREIVVRPGLLTDRIEDVVGDPEIAVVVEVMPGTEPARGYLLEALRAGKHVVSANKELFAKHGAELRAAAREGGAGLYFEAAVAGGIPIIKSLNEALAANRVQALMGIINGTTNYMLTRMTERGEPFADVLRDAQAQGYAEADPTNDIAGYDAAYKLALLAQVAFGSQVDVGDIPCEGITAITPEDIEHARALGYVIKLLAIAKDAGGDLELRVHPTLIPTHHPLANVGDVFNAVFVEGDAVGELMFYGRGAGRFPTASAVVADIIDAAQNLRRGICGRLTEPPAARRVLAIDECVSRFYIHMRAIDQPGVLARVSDAFGREDVSIESMIQKGRRRDPVSIVFVTHEVKERNVRAALAEIDGFSVVREIANVIRVEGD